MKYLCLFLTILLCSSLSFARSNSKESLSIEDASHLVATVENINKYTTSKIGEITTCNYCSDNNEKTFLEKTKDRFEKKYLEVQGKGVSIGVDVHTTIVGGNYSIELLQFGNIFTLFNSSKGIKLAAYCVGGIGGGSDLFNATLDMNKVRTFGKCNSPKNYTGGFLNLGAQGAITPLYSAEAKMSISFDMHKFANLLGRSFSEKKKLIRLREQVLQYISMSAENLLLRKIISSIFFPDKMPPIQIKEVDEAKSRMKKNESDIFKYLISNLEDSVEKKESLICNKPNNCQSSNPSEFKELLSIIKSSIGQCHAITYGISAGASITLPISSILSYSDYILISTFEINLADLGSQATSFLTSKINDLWSSFTRSCASKDTMNQKQEETIKSFEQTISDIVKIKFDKQALEERCKNLISRSSDHTNKAMEYVLVKQP